MSDVKLGTTIAGGQHRDAIHIAIAPVSSDEVMYPGMHVALMPGSTEKVTALGGLVSVGIVDPFLKHPVPAGQSFWLLLYPQTITGLRHEWTHPAFRDDAKEESRKWLEAFAARLFSYNPSSGSRLETLLNHAESGCFGTDIEYADDCKPNDEFWMHFERFTGRKAMTRPEYFRCAC